MNIQNVVSNNIGDLSCSVKCLNVMYARPISFSILRSCCLLLCSFSQLDFLSHKLDFKIVAGGKQLEKVLFLRAMELTHIVDKQKIVLLFYV